MSLMSFGWRLLAPREKTGVVIMLGIPTALALLLWALIA